MEMRHRDNRNRIGNFSDHYREGEAPHSSQGPIGYVGEVGHRFKGFLTHTRVDNESDVTSMNAFFRQGIRELESEGNERFTKLSVRVVARLDIVDRLDHVEAVLPLDGVSFDGRTTRYGIVYLGYNRPETRVSDGQLNEYANTVKLAESERYTYADRAERLRHIHDAGYRTEMLDFRGTTARERAELTSLLEVHHYDAEQALAVLQREGTFIAVARDRSNRIVGMSALEVVNIDVNGTGVRMAEITDSVVIPELRNSGLNLALGTSIELFRHASASNVDVLYGEANLGKVGSIVTQVRRGESFFNRDGVMNGILQSHAFIDDKLESLALAYASRDTLAGIASNLPLTFLTTSARG